MAKKKTIQPRDLWIVDLTVKTFEKGPVGHEQGYRRPCLVMVYNKFAELCTVIPLTSQLSATHYPHTYLLKKTNNNGLTLDSVALIFQMRSLSKKRFLNKIGVIDKKDLTSIKHLISNYFQL